MTEDLHLQYNNHNPDPLDMVSVSRARSVRGERSL